MENKNPPIISKTQSWNKHCSKWATVMLSISSAFSRRSLLSLPPWHSRSHTYSIHGSSPSTAFALQRWDGNASVSYLQLDVESRLVEVELRLEAERMELLGDNQRTLHAQSNSQHSKKSWWRVRLTPSDQINHLICSISGNFLLLKLLREEQ